VGFLAMACTCASYWLVRAPNPSRRIGSGGLHSRRGLEVPVSASRNGFRGVSLERFLWRRGVGSASVRG
jgi:hypothetical protein